MNDGGKPLFRDAIGVFAAFTIVAAFITIGFLDFFAHAFLNLEGKFDAGWIAAMLSLASAAFGFLIGKRSNVVRYGFDRPLCSTCPIRDAIENKQDGK